MKMKKMALAPSLEATNRLALDLLAQLSQGVFVVDTIPRLGRDELKALSRRGYCYPLRQLAEGLMDGFEADRDWLRLTKRALRAQLDAETPPNEDAEGAWHEQRAVAAMCLEEIAQRQNSPSDWGKAMQILREGKEDHPLPMVRYVYAARYWLAKGENYRVGRFRNRAEPRRLELAERCYFHAIEAGRALECDPQLRVPSILRCARVNLLLIAVETGDLGQFESAWRQLRSAEPFDELMFHLREMSEVGAAMKWGLLTRPHSLPTLDDCGSVLAAWTLHWQASRGE